jgi:hypothetical protein
MLERNGLARLGFILFCACTLQGVAESGKGKGTQTEFPDTNIFGTPEGNYKRQLALGFRPTIRPPGQYGHSGHVEFPDTNIFGTPQGNYKRYLEQQGVKLNQEVAPFVEGATARGTDVTPETTLFEIDLERYFKSSDASCLVSTTHVKEPGRLYMVRYNLTGKFMMTLSVKTGEHAVLSDAPLKQGDFIPGSAGGLKNAVVELVSDDPKGMRWARHEWNSPFESFLTAYAEKQKPLRPTTMPASNSVAPVSAVSRTLDGFAIAGSTAGSDPRNRQLNESVRVGTYDEQLRQLKDSIASFANPNYCVRPRFDVKAKQEYGSGKYFGDYSHASLSFDVLPRKGYSIKTLEGPAFTSKASSGSTASREFMGDCQVQRSKIIWSKEIGGPDNYIASDAGKIEIKKVDRQLFDGTYTEVNWQFSSSGMRVLYWAKD